MFRRHRDEVSFWPALADLVLAVLLLVIILWQADVKRLVIKEDEKVVKTSDWERRREIKPDEQVVKVGEALNMVHKGSDELIVKKAELDRRREIKPGEKVVKILEGTEIVLTTDLENLKRRIKELEDELKRRPDKPLVFPLEEASGFAFKPGHAELPDDFKARLENEILQKIDEIVSNFPIEVMEVIGHTDGTPKGGISNLDSVLIGFTLDGAAESKIGTLNAGSNADLGLARALSVVAFLQSRFAASHNPKLQAIIFRAYSGAQLISPTDNAIAGAANGDVPMRRRIELRFTRKPKPEKP